MYNCNTDSLGLILGVEVFFSEGHCSGALCMTQSKKQCCQRSHAPSETRLPPALGPVGGGGDHWYEVSAASALPAKTTQLGMRTRGSEFLHKSFGSVSSLKYYFMFSLCNCNILSEIKSHQNCIAYLSLWSVACARAEFVPREWLITGKIEIG